MARPPRLKVYLAGGFFDLGEQLRNAYLAKALKSLGHEVILPQARAQKFYDSATHHIGLSALQQDCLDQYTGRDMICIACLDGPDPSIGTNIGTAIDFAIAKEKTGRAIGYRTDFRPVLDHCAGLDYMFGTEGSVFIRLPCLGADGTELDEFIVKLAKMIHEEILKIEKAEGRIK